MKEEFIKLYKLNEKIQLSIENHLDKYDSHGIPIDFALLLLEVVSCITMLLIKKINFSQKHGF